MKFQDQIATDTIFVTKEEEEIRIDKLLAERFDNYSRTYFQYLIENGEVLLNGQRIKKRIEPKLGDEIQIFFRLPPEISLEPENIPLDILFEDEHIIVVNKPANLVVHPGAGNPNHTFVNALLYHCKDLPDVNDSLRPGIVHRLDKNTSGVLIAAKSTIAHQRLIAAFSSRKINHKIYLAVCVGHLKNQTICAPIGRHPVNRKEMCILEKGGKEAITHTHLLATDGKLSLALLRPITGRTHQIRVHLKSVNTPVLGDEVYGSQKLNSFYQAERQLLHAYKLSLIHPVTKVVMDFVAPIPEDIKKLIRSFTSLSGSIAENEPVYAELEKI